MVPYNTTPDSIRSLICQHYTSDSFPEHAIDSLIHFSMIPMTSEFKQGHITISNQAALNSILNFFHTILGDNTDVYSSTTLPHTGIWSTHIDTSPTFNNTPPTNCQIRSCKLHGVGSPWTKALPLTLLKSHGLTFHEDLLRSLPLDILSSIHWYKCTDPCTSLCYTTDLLQQHFA